MRSPALWLVVLAAALAYPLAVLAEAAAEMGVTERDTAALEYIGEAVGGLIGGDGAAGERGR